MIMSSLWRRRSRGRGLGRITGKRDGTELLIPDHFRCPISLELMKDPVSLATGITYDRESIEKWIDTGNVTCPVSNLVLTNPDQVPNHALRRMIQDWCVENEPYGAERMPTPRVPLSKYEVSEVCSRMAAAATALDGDMCRELVAKIRVSAEESDRNKRCLVSNGIGATLAETFDRFSSEKKHGNLLKEVLSELTWSCPPGNSKLTSTASLHCVLGFLNGEDLSSRRSAILVLKELVMSSSIISVKTLMELEGVEEALVRVVKVPFCPRATQATLVVMHHLMLAQEKAASRFVEMGLVELALDIIIDGNNKSVWEKALGVLDGMICGSEEGRERACRNALTIPILVKKILRVSDVATGFCVSSMWRVWLGGKGEGGGGGGVVEALEVGGFQKLLVVLQVGCDERTKEKVCDLLKIMNVYRNKIECFDSSMGSFKYVKSQF